MTTKEILSKLLPVLLICAAILLLLTACSQDESTMQWEEDTLCTPEVLSIYGGGTSLCLNRPRDSEYQSDRISEINWRRVESGDGAGQGHTS